MKHHMSKYQHKHYNYFFRERQLIALKYFELEAWIEFGQVTEGLLPPFYF